MPFRPLALVLVAVLGSPALPAQFTLVDPNLAVSTVAAGIPGTRHQLAVEAGGAIYVVEELPGGFSSTTIHRVDVTGFVTLGWLPGLASAGQMLRSAGDGLVYGVHHWQGALEHNPVFRVESAGALSILHDVLWGVGHGFAEDAAGDLFLGVGATVFQAAQIWRIPAGQLGQGPELPYAPGRGDNAYLAPAGPSGSGLLLADGPSVWLIRPGQPDLAMYTPAVPAPVVWRGLLRNPFGLGHLVSFAWTAGAGVEVSELHWIGPGGSRLLATHLGTVPGDFALADGGGGIVLVIHGGTIEGIFVTSPLPQPPGLLSAPTTHPVTTPITVGLTGRPFALSPFLFAVDLPLGPPAFPTGSFPVPPFGVVHTSLGVLPTFLPVRDGLGAYLPADPLARLGPGGAWSETYPVPGSLSGLSLVLQAYILDSAAPNGVFWITPPVLTAFQ